MALGIGMPAGLVIPVIRSLTVFKSIYANTVAPSIGFNSIRIFYP